MPHAALREDEMTFNHPFSLGDTGCKYLLMKYSVETGKVVSLVENGFTRCHG